MKNLIQFTLVILVSLFFLTSCKNIIKETTEITILHTKKFKVSESDTKKYWIIPVKNKDSIFNVRYYSGPLSNNLFEEIYKIKDTNSSLSGIIYKYGNYWSLERIYKK